MCMTARIALVLASIHTGASNELFSEIAKQAQQSSNTLIVFPGGRLECQENQEHVRNAIYPLVNSENVDAVITWASSLGGSVSVDEVRQFLATMDPVPCVSIGMKREGSPAVSFDAYSGFQAVILHCIKEHQARRIAFLRGPQNHYSAIDRYRAYCDSLEQTGLLYDPRLVSSPYAWNEGAKAISELLEKNHLSPGKDFDTLVCSSDLMLFDAGKYLEAKGYRIPDDLRIVGYNDSRESHLLRIPCTTARMPVTDLAKMSWNLVDNLLVDGTSSCFDILLPSHPVIRRSCGCLYSLGNTEQARLKVGSKQQFLSWLIQSFEVKQTGQAQLKTLLAALEEDNQPVVLSLVESLSYQFFDRGGDPNLLSEALHWYSTFHAKTYMRQQLESDIRDVFLRQRDLIACEHVYALAQRAKILNALKCDLLGVRELEAVAKILKEHLPSLGLDEGYLVLHEDDQQSLFIGGYTPKDLLSDQQYFAKQLLLPRRHLQQLGSGVYVAEPLFMDSQPLGYFVVHTTLFDGSIMEELRTSLSSAIKGAFLLDAANRARQEAEEEQRARSEFFANISEGLRLPLEGILSLVAQQNDTLQQEVQKQVLSAQNLLDLSFSYTKEFTLKPETLELSSLLRELSESSAFVDSLPVVFADPDKLKQSLQIICEHIRREGGSVLITTSVQREGLLLSFRSSLATYKATVGKQDLSLALAQRILMMSKAMVFFEDDAILVRLPWPTFHGVASGFSERNAVYILSEGQSAAPALFSSISGIRCIKASAFGNKNNMVQPESVLLYDGQRKAVDLQLVMHHMINHLQFSSLAVIAYDVPTGYASLATALTAAKEEGLAQGRLVLCGALDKTLLAKIGLSDTIAECTEKELPSLLAQQHVNLVISDVINPKLYALIRKTYSVPIVLIAESWKDEDVAALSSIPNLLITHRCVEESFEFLARLLDLYYRQEVLPPLTGLLVKRALVYLETHAKSPISRWQLAEHVNVSEDYLTRIFHKEIGLSPWEYLNRYRIHLAVMLLKQSTLTINEIASQTGFQDQAYFCRVFRKIKGCAPSTMRMNN